MLRLASTLSLELLSFQPVYSRLSWSKNYAAKDIKFVNPYTKYKKVLVTAMCDEFCKIRDSNVYTGVTFKDVRKEIKMLIGAVSESLSSSAKKISTYKEIAQVATTWANGDKKIGRVIANAMDEIGNREGHILISSQEWKSPSIRLVFYSGIKLDQGYISSCFLNNKKKKSQTLYRPMVYVFESKLSDMHVVMEMLSISLDTVLIIAEDFEGDVLDTLITEKLITGAKVCAIKAPGYGEKRNAIIRDIHNVTGAKVITKKDCAQWTKKSKFYKRGSCAAAMVSENDTILLDNHYTKQEIKEEITKELRSNPKRIPDKDWLYAVIKVGGPNRENVRKKRCILTHALVAAKAAMEEGIVPGGGVAFLNASKELEKLQTTTSAQKIAFQIIQNALKMPLIKIVSTVEVEELDVVGKLLNLDNPNLGYDSTRGEFVDMINYGIVDPLKLIKKVFVEATSMFLKKPRGGMLKVGERTKFSYGHKWTNGVGRIQGKAI